jgi:hypothetical protein
MRARDHSLRIFLIRIGMGRSRLVTPTVNMREGEEGETTSEVSKTQVGEGDPTTATSTVMVTAEATIPQQVVG